MEATTTTATTDSNISCNPRKDNDAMSPSIVHIPPFPSTDASSSDILLSTVAKETTLTLENIPSALFIQHILPFVGQHQYRFVATVNHNFHTAYLSMFPKKVTRLNVSTMEHAKICFDEWKIRYRQPSILCCIAAREGNLSVLQYLRAIQCSWDARTCANAAKNGHLDVIQWCRENGCPWDAKTCENAAKNGHLNVVIWCHQNGCPWDENTCASAAENGHLDIIQWCRENGCPWNSDTCYCAANYMHIDVLKWCLQNGCEWESDTCARLQRDGYYDVLQWSFENGCNCIVCSQYVNFD
jgi:hypothetical protein